MHLIKTEVIMGNPGSLTTAWVQPKTLLQKALAEDLIEVDNWNEATKVISAKDRNLPPEVLGYRHTYNNFKISKDDSAECSGCVLECDPYIDGDVSKARLLEITKEFKKISAPMSTVQKAFDLKITHQDRYFVLAPDLVYSTRDGKLVSDPAVIKKVASTVKKTERERAQVSTQDLQKLLKDVNTVWNNINYPCIQALGTRAFYVSSFCELCRMLPHWVELANLMEPKYSWAKLRKWPGLAKKIWSSDEQLSNEIYAFGLRISKEHDLRTVLDKVFDPYIARMQDSYHYFFSHRYTHKPAQPRAHPKGVQDGIDRVYALINKKLGRRK